MAQNTNLTPSQIQEIAQKVKELLMTNSQGVGEVPVATTLDMVSSLPAIRKDGAVGSVVEVPLKLLGITLQKTATEIQWRHGDSGSWNTLVSLEEIKGGETEFRVNGYCIEWRYKNVPGDPWKRALDLTETVLNMNSAAEEAKNFSKEILENDKRQDAKLVEVDKIRIGNTPAKPTEENVEVYVDFSEEADVDAMIVGEAPKDGKAYVRKDGAWYEGVVKNSFATINGHPITEGGNIEISGGGGGGSSADRFNAGFLVEPAVRYMDDPNVLPSFEMTDEQRVSLWEALDAGKEIYFEIDNLILYPLSKPTSDSQSFPFYLFTITLTNTAPELVIIAGVNTRNTNQVNVMVMKGDTTPPPETV